MSEYIDANALREDILHHEQAISDAYERHTGILAILGVIDCQPIIETTGVDINEAIEKQIPKTPGTTKTMARTCPNCYRFIDRHEEMHGNIDIPCCKWCGQALDWRNP